MAENRYLGRWRLLDPLDKGGNGQVWKVHFEGQDAAMKILMRHDRVGRFRNEVEGMRRLQDISGVLPIIDAHIPVTSTKSAPAWFVMALATPLRRALSKHPKLDEVVSAIADIASVLSQIHARGFSHRDIKPENLFCHEDRWSVGDFGLIAFDGMSHETTEGEKLGPLHYIAPEMLNEAFGTDGRPADVFSIAKTLWVLATGLTYPLPGPYSAASEMCRLDSYVVAPRTTSLDLLIERCSVMEPAARPTMGDVASDLMAWCQEPAAKPVGPLKLILGTEWAEIATAADREKNRVRRLNEAHERKTLAVKVLEDRFIEFYKELRETLSAAHFVNIEGPDRHTFPPGVLAWLPIKSDESKRVGLEVRVWFSPDWVNAESYTFSTSLLARLVIQVGGNTDRETIHERQSSFLMGGSGERAIIQTFLYDITELLGKWISATRERRESLG